MANEEKDDEKEEKAERPAKEEPAEKPEPKPDPRVKEDDDGNVTVDLEPQRRTRRERRQEHYDELRRSRDELEAVRGRMAVLEAQLYARQQAPGQQQGPSRDEQYERALNGIRQQQEVIQAALRSGQVAQPDEVERLRRQFYDLDGQARKLDRDRLREELREDEERRRGSAPAGQYEETILRAEYPDVIAHAQAMRYATGLYYTMVAEGKPPNLATSRAAMERAAERFGLRQAALPQASASLQQKLGAVPGQAGTKGGNEVRLDASQKKMALARWPQLEEHQAYVKMAALLARSRESEQATE